MSRNLEYKKPVIITLSRPVRTQEETKHLKGHYWNSSSGARRKIPPATRNTPRAGQKFKVL
jgi:hypothetical protein